MEKKELIQELKHLENAYALLEEWAMEACNEEYSETITMANAIWQQAMMNMNRMLDEQS
jgi:hypothetical protein